MNIKDHLSETELADLEVAEAIDAKRTKQPTAAQRRVRSEALDGLIDALRGLDSIEACQALYEYVSARSDMAPPDLEWLGSRISRVAWMRERGDG